MQTQRKANDEDKDGTMNYCTKCHCVFTQPGTCNCFAPMRVTSGYHVIACSGCQRIPCDGSSTACTPPVTTRITCSNNSTSISDGIMAIDGRGNWVVRHVGEWVAAQ